MPRPVPRRVGLLVPITATALTLAACTSSGPGGRSPAAPATPPPSSGASRATPVAAPTRAVAAEFCPLVPTSFVRDTMGMRLGRLTTLRSGPKVVGCRFYALQGGVLHSSEHLPGAHQPAVEVSTQTYRSAADAHNAFVRLAQAGRGPQQVRLGSGRTGVCYQTRFDPSDHGTDWACGVSVGRRRVLVRTVDTAGAFSTTELLKQVLHAV